MTTTDTARIDAALRYHHAALGKACDDDEPDAAAMHAQAIDSLLERRLGRRGEGR